MPSRYSQIIRCYRYLPMPCFSVQMITTLGEHMSLVLLHNIWQCLCYAFCDWIWPLRRHCRILVKIDRSERPACSFHNHQHAVIVTMTWCGDTVTQSHSAAWQYILPAQIFLTPRLGRRPACSWSAWEMYPRNGGSLLPSIRKSNTFVKHSRY